MPRAQQCQAIEKEQALHQAYAHPAWLKKLLACYPDEQRLTAILMKNKERENVMYLAADYPESVTTILNCLPETQRLASLKRIRVGSILQKLSHHVGFFNTLFSNLPETLHLRLLKGKLKHDVTGKEISIADHLVTSREWLTDKSLFTNDYLIIYHQLKLEQARSRWCSFFAQSSSSLFNTVTTAQSFTEVKQAVWDYVITHTHDPLAQQLLKHLLPTVSGEYALSQLQQRWREVVCVRDYSCTTA